MRRFPSLLLFLTIVGTLVAQNVRLVDTPVRGLPSGAQVLRYAVVEAEDGNRLVAEVQGPDGVLAFYVFVYAEGQLVASAIGPRTIPARFEEPPTHLPTTLRFEGEARTYWPVAGLVAGEPVRYVNAPNLAGERFAAHREGAYPASPVVGSSLTLALHTLGADQSLVDTCVLEPNILAAEDRMTTAGAWMVQPYDARLLLVAVAHTTGESRGRIVPRLYSERGELVALAPAGVSYSVNQIPAVIQADLTGNGVDELILFPTEAGGASPMLVLRPLRNESGRRVLAFNLCSARMNGEDVMALQLELADGGYDLGVHGIDGWYGPDTRAAVIEWQRDRNALVSGVVDLTGDLID